MPLLQLPIPQKFVVIQQIKACRLHRCANDWMTYIPAVYLQSNLNNTNIIIHWYYYHSYYLTVNNFPNYVMCRRCKRYREIVYIYIYIQYTVQGQTRRKYRNKREGKEKFNFSSYKKKYRRRKKPNVESVSNTYIYFYIYQAKHVRSVTSAFNIIYYYYYCCIVNNIHLSGVILYNNIQTTGEQASEFQKT